MTYITMSSQRLRIDEQIQKLARKWRNLAQETTMNPTFEMCFHCQRMDAECRASYAKRERCEQELRDKMASEGTYEVVVEYCGGKSAHLGAQDRTFLRALINAVATRTDLYGTEFEIIVLNRGLWTPNANMHYLCRGKRLQRQWEHTSELEAIAV